MPRIAVQHREGSPLAHDVDHRPLAGWPADAMVQWGSGRSFMAYGASDTGSPAFFEAFLAGPERVHVSGTGATIALAEAAAYDRFLRYASCAGHAWIRVYDEHSGVGRCALCGARGTHALPAKDRPEPLDGPLTPRDLGSIALGLLKPRADLGEERDRLIGRWREAVVVRAARHGFALPDASLEHDAYREACEAAVGAFWRERRAWYFDHPAAKEPPRFGPAFLDPLVVGCLDDYARSVQILGRQSQPLRES